MAKRARVKKQQPSLASTVANAMLEQLHALDEQRKAIIDGAKGEAIKAANAAVAALNAMGFNYRLTAAPTRGRAKAAGSRQGTRKVKEAPCPVCHFQTSPPHDARAHRGQKDKKPFTASELSAKGLKKV